MKKENVKLNTTVKSELSSYTHAKKFLKSFGHIYQIEYSANFVQNT